MRSIVVIAHNLRSTYNVGSLLRTADGLGVQEVIFTGYSPYPLAEPDSRLPHLARKLDGQIRKTALGAEKSMKWRHEASLEPTMNQLKQNGYHLAALEQSDAAFSLPEFEPPDKLVLIVGREVEGLEPEVLALCDSVLEIPMFGQKESFNVIQAAAMALYHCRFAP